MGQMMKEKEKAQGPFRLSDPDFRNAELAMRNWLCGGPLNGRERGRGVSATGL
jgi:hypothetical protein